MTDNIIKTLTDYGLSDKEAKIYVALLELELATVYEIAKHSGLNRSSTYVVLESLKEKGLAGTSPDKKVVRYFASSPDSLLHSAQTFAKKQEEIKNNIGSIIPELKALHKDTKHRPKVRVYEGKNGVAEALHETFIGNDPPALRVYADPVKMSRSIPGFLETNQERANRGIKMYAINPASKEVVEFGKKYPPPEGDTFLLIPEEKFKFSANIAIRGNRITFISIRNDFAVLIENKELAGSFASSFDLAWEEAKRLDKEIKKILKETRSKD